MRNAYRVYRVYLAGFSAFATRVCMELDSFGYTCVAVDPFGVCTRGDLLQRSLCLYERAVNADIVAITRSIDLHRGMLRSVAVDASPLTAYAVASAVARQRRVFPRSVRRLSQLVASKARHAIVRTHSPAIGTVHVLLVHPFRMPGLRADHVLDAARELANELRIPVVEESDPRMAAEKVAKTVKSMKG